MESDKAEFCSIVHPELMRVLTVHCGDSRVAEEIAQEALARAISQWSKVRSMDYPKAWVYRVAFNLAATRWKRRALERRILQSQRPPQPVPDPAERSAEVAALRDAIAQLPPRQRAAVTLRYLSDLSVNDAAAALKCKPGTIRSLTTQASSTLRDRLATRTEPVGTEHTTHPGGRAR